MSATVLTRQIDLESAAAGARAARNFAGAENLRGKGAAAAPGDEP